MQHDCPLRVRSLVAAQSSCIVCCAPASRATDTEISPAASRIVDAFAIAFLARGQGHSRPRPERRRPAAGKWKAKNRPRRVGEGTNALSAAGLEFPVVDSGSKN
jgi:hypothetical protein